MAVIIFGNVKRIAKVSELVVPFMSVAYIVLALIVIFANIKNVPETFRLIFASAFGADAVFGGMLGSAIVWGVKRGVNSCSAGMGTAPQSAAAAETSHPVKQGMVQAVSVYVDTLLVCTATALMVLVTNSYNVVDPVTGENIVSYMGDVAAGAIYAQTAADSVLPGIGSPLVAIALFFFAFTSLMAAYYIGETNVVYFMGDEKREDEAFLHGYEGCIPLHGNLRFCKVRRPRMVHERYRYRFYVLDEPDQPAASLWCCWQGSEGLRETAKAGKESGI